MAVGLQVFGLQSQPNRNRKVSAREAAGTSNPHANSKMGLSPTEIDGASVDVASVPPQREDGRSGSAYAHRNVPIGFPGENCRKAARSCRRQGSNQAMHPPMQEQQFLLVR